MIAEAVHRGDVFLMSLDPARGGEICRCVVVSPDELNACLRTFIVAPLTTGSHPYPFRVRCNFQGRTRHIVLDQIRTVDWERLVRRLRAVSASTLEKVLAILQQMFAP